MINNVWLQMAMEKTAEVEIERCCKDCRAFEGTNQFKIFSSHYKEHPDYADPKVCDILKSRLGEEAWKQELEMEFLD